MSEAPLSFQLPNGLELTMFPKDHAKSTLTSLVKREQQTTKPETRAELWARFIGALKTTDFKALASFYESAMPKAEPHVLTRTVPAPSNPPANTTKAP